MQKFFELLSLQIFSASNEAQVFIYCSNCKGRKACQSHMVSGNSHYINYSKIQIDSITIIFIYISYNYALTIELIVFCITTTNQITPSNVCRIFFFGIRFAEHNKRNKWQIFFHFSLLSLFWFISIHVEYNYCYTTDGETGNRAEIIIKNRNQGRKSQTCWNGKEWQRWNRNKKLERFCWHAENFYGQFHMSAIEFMWIAQVCVNAENLVYQIKHYAVHPERQRQMNVQKPN